MGKKTIKIGFLNGTLFGDFHQENHNYFGKKSDIFSDKDSRQDSGPFEDAKIIDGDSTETESEFSELPEDRRRTIIEIMDLIEKGPWIAPATVENMKQMMKDVLGVGASLDEVDKAQSKLLWDLFDQRKGRGNRVAVTWLNIVGYLKSKGFLEGKAPALCKSFYGVSKDSVIGINCDNINKGDPSGDVSDGFGKVIPLLNNHLPK